ncbi:MAG: SCO family protein [Candidatus Electrothrix sp. AR4]|nr:SCO family protein [Candidatus Electrothrix sp. AR4]
MKNNSLLLCLLLFFFMHCYVSIAAEHTGHNHEQSHDQSSHQGHANAAGGKEYKAGDPELDVQWVNEKTGNSLPLERTFQDENGNTASLGDIIVRPALLLPIYFYCPNSCTQNLVNLANAVKRSRLKPGEDFQIIALSFNEKEDHKNAKIAQQNYLRLLPKTFPKESWKFLTGDKESILTVTDSIGYTFKAQEDGTFIHPSALVAVSGDGKIIKYVYGSFISGDVDMALTEAQSGTPALSVRRFLGYCFNYSPEKSRSFFKNLKISVLIGCAILGLLFFLRLRRREKKKAFVHDEHDEHRRQDNEDDGS